MEETAAFQKNPIIACLSFAEVHLDTPKCCWQNVLRTDETKVEITGKNTQCYICPKGASWYECVFL